MTWTWTRELEHDVRGGGQEATDLESHEAVQKAVRHPQSYEERGQPSCDQHLDLSDFWSGWKEAKPVLQTHLFPRVADA